MGRLRRRSATARDDRRRAERSRGHMNERETPPPGRSLKELRAIVAEDIRRFERLGELWSSLPDEQQVQLIDTAQRLYEEASGWPSRTATRSRVRSTSSTRTPCSSRICCCATTTIACLPSTKPIA